MKIAVFDPPKAPFSIRNYSDNVTTKLEEINCSIRMVKHPKDVNSDVDIYWDPLTGGLQMPYLISQSAAKHNIITFHGGEALSMERKDYFNPWSMDLAPTYLAKRLIKMVRIRVSPYRWGKNFPHVSGVITVSSFGKKEFRTLFPCYEGALTAIHHGVDTDIFYPDSEVKIEPAYFLHISTYQHKKNVLKIVEAYSRLFDAKNGNIPKLKIVSVGFPAKVSHPGIEVSNKGISLVEVAELMRGAIAFIFPSLHETFGMPILEAMACGCPVITSNSTGCAEVAESCAILVNPFEVEEIEMAMGKILSGIYTSEREEIKITKHAKKYTWESSAEKHIDFFKGILNSV